MLTGGSELHDLYITTSNEDNDCNEATAELIVARMDGTCMCVLMYVCSLCV